MIILCSIHNFPEGDFVDGCKWFRYGNREISWLQFNGRVLEEAREKKYPVIERLKFLGITTSNLDEFFMVRMDRIHEKIEKKPKKKDFSGLRPERLFGILSRKLRRFMKSQYKCMRKEILPDLAQEEIKFLKYEELGDRQKGFLESYFEHTVFPVLTPMAIDPGRPFPFISGRSLNIAVEMKNSKKETVFGIVQVPSILPRYVELAPDVNEHSKVYVMLEEIIINQMPSIFQLNEIKSSMCFRITRNTDSEINEEAESILAEIKKNIKKRKRGDVVRLEIEKRGSRKIKKFLMKALDTEDDVVYEIKGPIDLTFWLKFSLEDWPEEMRFKKYPPANPPADFRGCEDIFAAIRENDRMVHHPFESFDAVVNFVRTAARDENVLAIKQVLYRVSNESPIVDTLIEASENGKQVTAFVELKARFDEENNILWAQKLEKSGCHVVYGIPGLKTHCKIILVIRKEEDSIRRYLHLGTGNYNDKTSKFYTDIGMFTCRTKFGIDASNLFNVLTGFAENRDYRKLVVSPHGTRPFFERMIRNEIKNAKVGIPAKIIFKVNSIVDREIINLLYEASCAGVKIRLIVRGMNCLIPRVKNMSENIKVISIVGRLLEHSRIFYFENGGNPQIFMGSADLMSRNLDKRIEVIFPVEDENLKRRTSDMLKIILSDNVNARVQDCEGDYKRVKREGGIINSQVEFYESNENFF
jgi:polyphosphate kinase